MLSSNEPLARQGELAAMLRAGTASRQGALKAGWRSACANLSQSTYMAQLAASGGSKRRFFELAAELTPPLNLTNVRHSGSDITLDTTLRFAFIGDSLPREMVAAWHAVAPRGVSWYVFQDRASLVGTTPPHVKDAIEALRNGSIDALFVGFGLHYVLRRERWGGRPWTEQRAWRAQNIARMAELAHETGRPVAIVGSLPIDAEVFMLDPAKKDYDEFHDLSFRRVQVALEQELMRHHPRLFRIPLDQLANACPGTRCDAVHWSADFDSFSCRSAFGLLTDFFAEWLVDSGMLAAAEASRGSSAVTPGSCRSVPWETHCPRSPPRHYLHGASHSMCHCHDAETGLIANHMTWAF